MQFSDTYLKKKGGERKNVRKKIIEELKRDKLETRHLEYVLIIYQEKLEKWRKSGETCEQLKKDIEEIKNLEATDSEKYKILVSHLEEALQTFK